MIRIISIILFGLILSQSCFPQQQLFGSKISGNGDIISDVILIQDGFVLDSAFGNIYNGIVDSNSKKYQFEYYEGSKLKRDIYSRGLRIRELINGLYVTKYLPGCYLYFYNEKGYIDSTIRQYWYDTVWVNDHRVDYSYDDNDNLLSKVYLLDGDTTSIEENSYDSAGNLILHKKIDMPPYEGTTYNIREYDSHNRLILTKQFNGTMPDVVYQYIYQYDSSGNVNSTYQSIEGSTTNNYLNHYFEFDENDRIDYEIMSTTYIDSAWLPGTEILFVYDDYGKILSMGDLSFYYYNQDGNLDSSSVLHPIYSGYLGNKATLIDSYGNKIILTDYNGTTYFYYRKVTTGIEENKTGNMIFNLSQNYPNPFNPTTGIDYQLATGGHVTLKVYDILGREIAELVNEFKTAGKYSIQFDGSNLASGVYIYKIQTESFSDAKKFILMK